MLRFHFILPLCAFPDSESVLVASYGFKINIGILLNQCFLRYEIFLRQINHSSKLTDEFNVGSVLFDLIDKEKISKLGEPCNYSFFFTWDVPYLFMYMYSCLTLL